LGISALQHSSDQSITLQLYHIPLDSSLRPYHFHPYHFSAKKFYPARTLFSSPIFSPLFETYSIRFISSPLSLFIHIIFLQKISDPACSLFSSPVIMAHTRNQELESRFNTLQSGLLETQQEVQQLSATIASRDASMNASVNVVCSPQWRKSNMN
jgi:hypothetical protein